MKCRITMNQHYICLLKHYSAPMSVNLLFHTYHLLWALLAVWFFDGKPISVCATVKPSKVQSYQELYQQRLMAFEESVAVLVSDLEVGERSVNHKGVLLEKIHELRQLLKSADFWIRYLDPIQYRKVNGVLPVEWEVEVFEKWEPPYRRIGGGLFLAESYLAEQDWKFDSLKQLLRLATDGLKAFHADTNALQLMEPSHLYFANRLFLLNLGSIYTTGFECPSSERILPELLHMLNKTRDIYVAFNLNYPEWAIPQEYLNHYYKLLFFVNSNLGDYHSFDHFKLIKDYLTPLYRMNAQCIRQRNMISKSMVDYSINAQVDFIFSKELVKAQEPNALYKRASPIVWNEVQTLGEKLFHEPMLSGNLQRSCASCHKPTQFFTDTSIRTPLAFDGRGLIARNAPSLINAQYNHLIMMDGQHLSLKDQIRSVHKKEDEMNGNEDVSMDRMMSCPDYKKSLTSLALKSGNKNLSIEHVFAAIIAYYTSFDTAKSVFDLALEGKAQLVAQAYKGFNLFMGKAQCATCHFPPLFGGIKPPYSSNEFESLGVPIDSTFKELSHDLGRFLQHPVPEMYRAFRTGSLRNVARTKPYMHNGSLNNLEEVIEFYNQGGGKGRGLQMDNQTLNDEKLNLTEEEKKQLVKFLESLNEDVQIASKRPILPKSSKKEFNVRESGGIY